MKRCVVFILVCCCLVSAQTQYMQDTKLKPSFRIYAAEYCSSVSGGLIGAIGGFLVGGIIGFGLVVASGNDPIMHEEYAVFLSFVSCCGALAGSASGCALGTRMMGNALEQNGRYLPSLIGATTGAVLNGCLYLITKQSSVFLFAPILLPIGSVIGYNLSRPKLSQQNGFFYNHLQMPSIGLRLEKDNQGKTISSLDLKLINARF